MFSGGIKKSLTALQLVSTFIRNVVDGTLKTFAPWMSLVCLFRTKRQRSATSLPQAVSCAASPCCNFQLDSDNALKASGEGLLLPWRMHAFVLFHCRVCSSCFGKLAESAHCKQPSFFEVTFSKFFFEGDKTYCLTLASDANSRDGPTFKYPSSKSYHKAITVHKHRY